MLNGRLPRLALASVLFPVVVSSTPLEKARARELWETPRELMVRLPEGHALATSVDRSVFGPLEPGVTLEAAAEQLGPPEQLFRGAYYGHWRYARYRTARGFVEVAYEPGESSCGTHHRRTLYAYPDAVPWPPSAVFDSAFVRTLRLPLETTRFLVTDSGGRDRMWFLLRDGKIVVLNWYRSAE